MALQALERLARILQVGTTFKGHLAAAHQTIMLLSPTQHPHTASQLNSDSSLNWFCCSTAGPYWCSATQPD